MKIHIYYGGRGLIGDPTLFAVRRMIKVFEELNVRVEKFDLCDQKTNISTLPQTLKEADGIILAATVEWHGVGGYMMSFLDACWLYGDKDKIAQLYMAPVVLSTTYGEKEAELDLVNAWQTLGGVCCVGLSGYVPEVSELEKNEAYLNVIEKSAESIYRSFNQKRPALPVSTMAVTKLTYKTKNTTLTQQEREQLSEYSSNEKYVERQKEDIRELADMFKGRMMSSSREVKEGRIPALLRDRFKPKADTNIKVKINIKGKDKPLAIRIDGSKLDVDYKEMVYSDAELTTELNVLEEIFDKRKSFQGGFMDGSVIMKGNFQILRVLDEQF